MKLKWIALIIVLFILSGCSLEAEKAIYDIATTLDDHISNAVDQDNPYVQADMIFEYDYDLIQQEYTGAGYIYRFVFANYYTNETYNEAGEYVGGEVTAIQFGAEQS